MVIDTSAIVAILRDEPRADALRRAIVADPVPPVWVADTVAGR